MSRILILTGSLPYPPASGGALRVYGIINGLHRAGYTVTLLAFHDGTTDPMTTPLAAICQRILTVPLPSRSRQVRLRDLVTTRQPDIAHRLYSEAMLTTLRDTLLSQDFDVVQFEGIEVAAYLPVVKRLRPGAKLVFDTFNAEYLLQRTIAAIDRRNPRRLPAALYSFIQAGRIERFEQAMCQLADAVIAVSPEDAGALRGFRQDGNVTVVPSGIFVDDYEKPSENFPLPPKALVFTGKMDYRPNVDAMLWFTEAIFPQVQAHMPDAHLVIVGQRPHDRLSHLNDQPNITLTGWVDSVQPYLHAADIYIAPLRMGSGTRLKLLEAMASGCAIVATTTAAAGLLDDVKQAMVIADQPHDYAKAIADLMSNPTRRADLGDMAYQRVRTTYDWSVIIPRLLTVYGSLGIMATSNTETSHG